MSPKRVWKMEINGRVLEIPYSPVLESDLRSKRGNSIKMVLETQPSRFDEDETITTQISFSKAIENRRGKTLVEEIVSELLEISQTS